MIDLNEAVLKLAERAEADLAPVFARIDAIARENTARMLSAFQENRVSAACFAGTTGYGYDDRGREVLDQVAAQVFGAEDAIVRINFINGTHALSTALFGVLRPGDTLVSCFGAPYDTLQTVIGIAGDEPGNLRQFGVQYVQVEGTPEGQPDLPAILRAVQQPGVRMATIQRSRGYSDRAALTVAQLGEIIAAIHAAAPQVVVMVDNCYGEFVQEQEPTMLGADLMVGSLIKNPGGGLAVTGGYIAGRHDLVEACAMRLTCPGVGREGGATLDQNRLLYQGFFLAPHTVAQAVKTAALCARCMELLGYETSPAYDAPRSDIVQRVRLNSAEALAKFCRGIQRGAPVDSFVTPEPCDTPGYEDQVIMAAGAFVQGASIELSADGPMRPPFDAFMQGGLTYESGRLGILLAVQELMA